MREGGGEREERERERERERRNCYSFRLHGLFCVYVCYS